MNERQKNIDYSPEDMNIVLSHMLYISFDGYKDFESYLLKDTKNAIKYVLPVIDSKKFKNHNGFYCNDNKIDFSEIINKIFELEENNASAHVIFPFYCAENYWVTGEINIYKADSDSQFTVSYAWYSPYDYNEKKIFDSNNKYEGALRSAIGEENLENISFKRVKARDELSRVDLNSGNESIILKIDSGVAVVQDITLKVKNKGLVSYYSDLIDTYRAAQFKIISATVRYPEIGAIAQDFVNRHTGKAILNHFSTYYDVSKKIRKYVVGESLGDKSILGLVVMVHLMSAVSNAGIIPASVLLSDYLVGNEGQREKGIGQKEVTLVSIYAAMLMLDFCFESVKSYVNSLKTSRSSKKYLDDLMRSANSAMIPDDEISRIISNMYVYSYFQNYLTSIIGMPINFVKVSVGFLLFGIYYGYQFSIVLTAALVSTMATNYLKVKYQSPLNSKSNDAVDSVAMLESDLLTRSIDIKLYGRDALENHNIQHALDSFSRAVNKSSLCYTGFDIFQKLIYSVSFSAMTVLSLYFYHKKVGENDFVFQFDDVSFVEMFTLRFIFFLISFNGDFYNTLDSVLWLKKRMDILDEMSVRASQQPKNGDVKIIENPSMICFNEVSLEISGKTILRDVSFEVKKGEKVAIVGKTGSGKSTILKLLMRLYDPTSGNITMQFTGSTQNLNQISMSDLRNHTVYFPQRPNLFPSTVHHNLAYADPRLESMNYKPQIQSKKGKFNYALWCKSLRDLTDNKKTSEKYLESVGLLGSADRETPGLSGGEKQRVSLSKGLLRSSLLGNSGAEMFLFDEVTSDLDPKTENDIQSLIYSQGKDKTIFMVTHRMRLIRDSVDKVLVIGDGKVEFFGPPSEATKNYYFKSLLDAELCVLAPTLFKKSSRSKKKTKNKWYSDDDISNLLKIEFDNVANIEIFTPILGSDWLAGNTLHDQLLQFIATKTHIGLSNQPDKLTILIPANLGTYEGVGLHWILIAIYISDDPSAPEKIFYFDPLGNQIPDNIYQFLKSDKLFPSATIVSNMIRIQDEEDGVNCGPWIVEAAKLFGRFTENVDQRFNDSIDVLKKVDINAVRGANKELLDTVKSIKTTSLS